MARKTVGENTEKTNLIFGKNNQNTKSYEKHEMKKSPQSGTLLLQKLPNAIR